MQKQKILKAELPKRSTRSEYEATAAIVNIAGVDHLICDLYRKKDKFARYVISDKDYGKYLYHDKKWTKLNGYSGPHDPLDLFGVYEWRILGKMVVSDNTINVLKQFGIKRSNNSSNSWMECVTNHMDYIRSHEAKKKRQTENELTDYLFSMIPDIPEDFIRWAKDLFKNKMYLLYKRETKYRATVGCCACGTTVTVHTDSINPDVKAIPVPRKGELGECQWCGTYGKYKPVGRFGQETIHTDCYLYQALPDKGLLIRHFQISLKQYGRYSDVGHEFKFTERARVFIAMGRKAKVYWNHQWYLKDKEHWCSYNYGGYAAQGFSNGSIYPDYKEVIANTDLRYANYYGYAYTTCKENCVPSAIDYMEALKAYAYCPEIDMLHKQGLDKFVRHLCLKQGSSCLLNKKGKNIPDILKIKSSRINLVRDKKGDINILAVLQLEKKCNLKLSDEDIKWLSLRYNYYEFPKELKALLKYMPLKKLINRIEKYREEYQPATKYTDSSWIAYRDYIKIREELGYDMTNSVYLAPRSLVEAHAAMIKEREETRNSEHIAKKREEFNEIPKRFKALEKKLGFEAYGYIFIPAKDAGEIIIEGRALHHCVGGDSYLKKHNTGETSIIFMRKKDCPDIPYVTIEVKKDKILQWYGAHDKKPQEQATLNAIKEFEEHIKGNKKADKNTTADLLMAAV